VRAAKLAADSSSTVCDWSAKVDASGIGMHALLASLICTALLVGLAVHASNKARDIEDLHNKRALVLLSQTNPMDICIGGFDKGRWFVEDEWPLANCYAIGSGQHYTDSPMRARDGGFGPDVPDAWCQGMSFRAIQINDSDGTECYPDKTGYASNAMLRFGVLNSMVGALSDCGAVQSFYTLNDIRVFAQQDSTTRKGQTGKSTWNTSAYGSEDDVGSVLLDVVRFDIANIPKLSNLRSRVYCPVNDSNWKANKVSACDSFVWRLHSTATGQVLWMQVNQNDTTARCVLDKWRHMDQHDTAYDDLFDSSWALDSGDSPAGAAGLDPNQLDSNYGVWLTWSARQVWTYFLRNDNQSWPRPSTRDPNLYECMNNVDVAHHDKFRDHVGTADQERHSKFLRFDLDLSYADIYAFYTGSLAAVFGGVAALLASLTVVVAVLFVRCLSMRRSAGMPAKDSGCMPVVAQC
jgi:hypothetical protein